MTRIISGEWRGHTLPKLKTGSVRPTTDRARTMLFDTLRDLRGLKVLDLYSGTGAFGFEALSRGAASLISIDKEHEYIKQQNLWIDSHLRPFKGYTGDVLKTISRLTETFDLILADPPYDDGLEQPVLTWIESHLVPGGRFVFETNKQNTKPLNSSILLLEKEKVVADTRIQFYKAIES